MGALTFTTWANLKFGSFAKVVVGTAALEAAQIGRHGWRAAPERNADARARRFLLSMLEAVREGLKVSEWSGARNH